MSMRQRGFTLMELSIVIAIIGILAAILLPALARARESGRRLSCIGNLMDLSIGFHIYAQEHEQQLPWSGGRDNADCMKAMLGDYIPDLRSIECPSDSGGGFYARSSSREAKKEPMPPITSDLNGAYSMRVSYDYLGAYTRAPIVLPTAHAAIPRVGILWDLMKLSDATGGIDVAGYSHIPGGSNVLFLDGSIEFIKARDMPVQPIGIAYDPQQAPPPDPKEARRRQRSQR